MANIKIEVSEEAEYNASVKVKKEESWMPKSESDNDFKVNISTNSPPDSFSSCIGQERKSLYFKRKVNYKKEENDSDIKDYYSDDIAELDDKPLLKYRRPQNGFMQGYWPNPNEIDFEEFAKEVAADCIDDIPIDVPTDLPKVPGTKYVDLVVQNIPSFNCSLDSSDEEKYSIESTPQIEIKEKGKKKVKRGMIKKEIKNEVIDMQPTRRAKVSLNLKKEKYVKDLKKEKDANDLKKAHF